MTLIPLFLSDFWPGILNLTNAKQLKINEELMPVAWQELVVIFSFIQGDLGHRTKNVLFGIMLWKIFRIVWLKIFTCSYIFFPRKKITLINIFNRAINCISFSLAIIPNFTSIWWRILNLQIKLSFEIYYLMVTVWVRW